MFLEKGARPAPAGKNGGLQPPGYNIGHWNAHIFVNIKIGPVDERYIGAALKGAMTGL